MTVDTGIDLRCSTLAQALGESPTGTAGSWHRMILVELPLPWPEAIEDHPLLAGVAAEPGEGRSHRILALASALDPQGARPDDGFRVICYWRPVDAPFARFARAEVCAPGAELAPTIRHLIDCEDATLAALPDDGFAAGADAHGHAVRDLLVCTHGTRDRCCGKLGTELFRSLEGRLPPGVRLWRTSHTGGHRFAPTGLTFPDGGAWAGLDEDLAVGLVDRTVPAATAARRARGSVGLDSAPAQVADAAGLAAMGWPWADEPRRTADDAHGSAVTVSIATSGGRYRAVVAAGEPVPVPDCGNPLDAARKSVVPWSLVSFEAV